MVWVGSSGGLIWGYSCGGIGRLNWEIQESLARKSGSWVQCWLGVPSFPKTPFLRRTSCAVWEHVTASLWVWKTPALQGQFQSWYSICLNPSLLVGQPGFKGRRNRVHFLMERMAKDLWPFLICNRSMVPYYFWLDIYPPYLSLLPLMFYLFSSFLWFPVNFNSLSSNCFSNSSFCSFGYKFTFPQCGS